MNVTYRRDLEGVDWDEMKAILVADDFDNGRTPEQLQRARVIALGGCQLPFGQRDVSQSFVVAGRAVELPRPLDPRRGIGGHLPPLVGLSEGKRPESLVVAPPQLPRNPNRLLEQG